MALAAASSGFERFDLSRKRRSGIHCAQDTSAVPGRWRLAGSFTTPALGLFAYGMMMREAS